MRYDLGFRSTGLRMRPAPALGRQWFPCLDAADKMFTAELEVTVGYSFVAVCSGDLISQVICWHTSGAVEVASHFFDPAIRCVTRGNNGVASITVSLTPPSQVGL